MSDKRIKQLKEDLQKIKQQAKEHLEGWQRAKADYINREREIERQRSEWLEFATLSLILEILPIYEHFSQAIECKNKNDDFREGLERIKKQFDDFLKKLQIEKIKTVGENFNPEFHEAVSKDESGDKKEIENNTVVEEVSPGYKMSGKVIKVAKVAIR